MANSIEFAAKFMPIIDGVYKKRAVTEGMDKGTQVDFTGVNEVKVMKVSTTGLGDYDRETGYPAGDIALGWETLTLTEERGKELSIDRMDNEEALGKAFGTAIDQLMTLHAAPELDAFRFAKYASADGISTTDAADLTASTILDAIDEAYRQMDEDEIPEDGRRLYVSTDLHPVLAGAVQRQWGSDSGISNGLSNYNGMPILYVPKSRFYTSITLHDGSSAWGYGKATGATNINFMLCDNVG